MPTILLEQIIEILNNLYAGFGDYLNNLLVSLNLTKDDVSEINDNISAILDKASNISDNSDTITEVINYIDGKLTTTNSYLNSIDGTSSTISSVVNDIRTYTGSVVTPIGSIKTNTDRLVTNSNTISNNTDSISNNIGTISASAGSTASNTNQIATNTQNTYNKVVTMASDTTQMRADNQTIIGVLNDMYDIMASTPVTMPADHVTYDPMSSGLVATNVQDAIDEITTRPAVLPTASDVSYSGTTSGLSATNVQDAIDEVVTDIPATASALPISANDPTDTKSYIDTGLSGKQDALNNQEITITPNASVLGSNFTGACYQYGKVVCLFVQTASPSSEVAYQSIFLTGLPKPVYASSNNRVSLTDRVTNKTYRFRITDSGQLQEWFNSSGKIPSGADLYGTIVYLAE